MFDRVEDARMRLDEGLLMFHGVPIIVNEVHPRDGKRGDYQVYAKRIRDGVKLDFPLSSTRLDLTPVKLGFVNQFGSANYVMRTPSKMWKTGLHRNNLTCGNGRGATSFTAALANTIEGVFPHMEECMRLLRDEQVQSIAFSRDFKVDSNYQLFHKWHNSPVGTANEKRFKLNDESFFLQEKLNEVLP